jgi:cyclophilin family peptidyl-prolyl cis-trans isomerase
VSQISASSPRLRVEELELRLPPANDLFAVPAADAPGGTVQLRFEWGAGGAFFKNEVGVYAIDDALGSVNGLLPGDPGYAAAALSRAQVVFARGAGIGAKNELSMPGGQLFGLYLVSNNTTLAALAGQANAFFTFDAANADRIDHAQTRNRGDGGRDFRFEDMLGGGDLDYNDATISVTQTRAIATPGEVGQMLLATFARIARDAAYKNEVGLFRVDGRDGRVGNLKPGDVGYLAAALTSPTRQVIFSDTTMPGVTTRSLVLDAGTLYGFYIVTNGTAESWLARNPANAVGGGPLVYSSFADANPDGLEHIDWRSPTEFGLEDQPGGGDQDFNDMVIRYDFGAPVGDPSAPTPPPAPVDTTPPAGTFALVADTGVSATDKITNDTRITATITDASAITRLRAGFDTPVPLGYLDVLGNLSNGTLNITSTLATAINGGTPLSDGQHTLFVEAADAAGNSTLLQFGFTLDRTAPGEPIYDLAPLSDSGPTGDLRTDQNIVTLLGAAEPGVTLQLSRATVPGTPGTGIVLATTTANANGTFQFNDVPLLLGPNSFVVRAVDVAGNLGGTLAQTFTLNAPPTVANPIADQTVAAGDPDLTFDLATVFADAERVVRLATTFPTGQTGNIDINLFATQTPATVANFLAYVNSGNAAQNYDNSIFHRLASGFVLQGGGFKFDANGTDTDTTFPEIPKMPAVVNEPGVSNTRGTLAMAKLPGQPDSATNEFFFNLEDNSATLDAPTNNGQPSGGFTVFGQVMNGGQQTIDAISQLSTFPGPGLPGAPPFPIRQGADTSNFPLNVTANDLAFVTSARELTAAERMTFQVIGNTNSGAAMASVVGNTLTIDPVAAGMTTITVRATDLDGSVTTTQIVVTVT